MGLAIECPPIILPAYFDWQEERIWLHKELTTAVLQEGESEYYSLIVSQEEDEWERSVLTKMQAEEMAADLQEKYTLLKRDWEKTNAEGKTLHDEFAMAALTGLLSRDERLNRYINNNQMAGLAYELADAMLTIRRVKYGR